MDTAPSAQPAPIALSNNASWSVFKCFRGLGDDCNDNVDTQCAEPQVWEKRKLQTSPDDGDVFVVKDGTGVCMGQL